MTAEIRRATPSDASAITAVLWESRRQSAPWMEQRYTQAEALDYVRGILLVTSMVWVAVVDNAVVGYAALEHDVLEQLYVMTAHQRRGIGSRLLQIARQAAGTRMSLYVYTKNRDARRFYERHGFVGAQAGAEPNAPDMRYEWRKPAREKPLP